MKTFKSALTALAVSATALGAANAATIMDMFEVGVQSTDFSVLGELDQFDPSLGELNSITFILEGDVFGSASVESLDASASTVTAELAATITLNNSIDPGSPIELVVVIPTVDEMFEATAFDGTIDFGGTSGATFSDLSGNDVENSVITDPLDFTPYIGLGTFAVSIDALGTSRATGSGNIISQFLTEAGAKGTVIYDYTPEGEIPVPGALLLMGTALAGFGASRRKKA